MCHVSTTIIEPTSIRFVRAAKYDMYWCGSGIMMYGAACCSNDHSVSNPSGSTRSASAICSRSTWASEISISPTSSSEAPCSIASNRSQSV